MNNLLEFSLLTWLGQNWMLLVLVAFCAFFIITTFLKQRKEINNRNELTSSIKKGTKIVTTAGVYGVVESVEETTDGKIVTIKTGSSKTACTMTIHINAIMGIDNKKPVVYEDEIVEEVAESVEEVEEEVVEETPAEETAPKSTKKSSSKKSTK